VHVPVASWTDFRPRLLLADLVEGGVDFVVIGGVAVILHAQPRFTKDLDVCYATDATNLERTGAVLTALHARLRGIDEDVPFVADARALRQSQILMLTTDHGDIDLLVDPSGAPPYADLRADAEILDIDGIDVRVASIEHLTAMKRAAGRPQDLIDIEALEIARRRRGRRRRRPA
jgi:nucleotidyltransferase AbiEii toxin of type IV toxin-antitoxin system